MQADRDLAGEAIVTERVDGDGRAGAGAEIESGGDDPQIKIRARGAIRRR